MLRIQRWKLDAVRIAAKIYRSQVVALVLMGLASAIVGYTFFVNAPYPVAPASEWRLAKVQCSINIEVSPGLIWDDDLGCVDKLAAIDFHAKAHITITEIDPDRWVLGLSSFGSPGKFLLMAVIVVLIDLRSKKSRERRDEQIRQARSPIADLHRVPSGHPTIRAYIVAAGERD